MSGDRIQQLAPTRGVENDVLQTLGTVDRHMLRALLARVVHTAEPSE